MNERPTTLRRKYALLVEYDGTHFRGWQKQDSPPVRSIEEALTQAVSYIANEPVELIAAGRTDAGVHAENQIVHFETTAKRKAHSWLLGINSNLPEDCAVKAITTVSSQFHARFDAIYRVYRYKIYNSPFRSALTRFYATWIHHPLNIAKMQQAAEALIGEHDFSAFRSTDCQSSSVHRKVEYIQLWRGANDPSNPRYNEIVLEIKANAFLHHMVRNIVGTLLEVGRGREPIAYVEKVLASRDRTQGGITAPPQGLYLMEVGYPKTKAPNFDLEL